MAEWLHRTTKQYIPNQSAGTMKQSFPALVFVDGSGQPASNAEWIANPDLSSVVGQPQKYWLISGDTVSLMNQAARDAVDESETVALRDADKAQLDELRILKAFALTVLDEVNILRVAAGLQPRTEQLLINAIKARVDTL